MDERPVNLMVPRGAVLTVKYIMLCFEPVVLLYSKIVILYYIIIIIMVL